MNKPTFTLTSAALPDISGEKEMAVEFECIVVNCTKPRLTTLVWVDSQFTPEQQEEYEETGYYDDNVFINEGTDEPWLYTGWAVRRYPDEDYYEALTESDDFVVMAWRPIPELTPEYMVGLACEAHSGSVTRMSKLFDVRVSQDIASQLHVLELCNAISTNMRMKKIGTAIDIARSQTRVNNLQEESK